MLSGNAQYLTSFLVVKRILSTEQQCPNRYRNLLGYRELILASHPIGDGQQV